MWLEKVLPFGNAPEFTINSTSALELWQFRVLTYNSEGGSGECPTAQARSESDGTCKSNIAIQNNIDTIS